MSSRNSQLCPLAFLFPREGPGRGSFAEWVLGAERQMPKCSPILIQGGRRAEVGVKQMEMLPNHLVWHIQCQLLGLSKISIWIFTSSSNKALFIKA